MGASAPSGGGRAPISGINITPLVDVMLVLLVIMMVSATYIVSQTMKVDLPKTSTSDGSSKSLAAISVTKDHEIYFNKEQVNEDELVKKLRAALAEDKELTVIVSGDTKADYGQVVHILDVAREQGITRFAVNVDKQLK